MTMTVSRRQFLLGAATAVGASVLPAVAIAANDGEAVRIASLDAIMKRSLDAGACPGIALRICRYGKPLLARNYGQANLETATRVDTGSVFRIGSLTKQFVAALVLLLVSKGLVQLDAPASRYLAFFEGKPSFTLRELLNHTAGLHADDQAVSCPAGQGGPLSQRAQAMAIAAQKMLFDFPPGTAWLYSNANYIVLGALVEVVTNMPLARAASKFLFEPLGLRDTAFDDVRDVLPHRVDGYTPVDGHPRQFEHAAFIEIADAGGAGAMRSTADDLCAWHHALFSRRLMSASLVREMITPGRLRDGRLSSAHRYSTADANYGEVQYGMGLLIEPVSNGHQSVMHYGFINGFAVCLESFLDLGLTAAILCNGDMGPNMPFRDARRVVAAQWMSNLAPLGDALPWIRS